MSGKNILIVDDSPIVQGQLVQMLEEGGHTIIDKAADGDSAILKYKANKDKIDLVTLDITIPGKDGIQVLTEIMEMNPDARVVMISAMGKDNVIKDCMKIGAKNFIQKPFKKDKVLATVSFVTK